jgi:hypothetical protein
MVLAKQKGRAMRGPIGRIVAPQDEGVTFSPLRRGLIGPVRTQLRPASFAASSAASASCTIVSTLS